ncbi:hypothetical protein ACFL9U_06080 [Thermodesulfobacteriota bacterium]
MNIFSRTIKAGIIFILFSNFLSTQTFSTDLVTIVGSINTFAQIVAKDGQIYEIAENEPGDEVSQRVNQMVKVSGTVVNIDGVKLITVASFEVVGP